MKITKRNKDILRVFFVAIFIITSMSCNKHESGDPGEGQDPNTSSESYSLFVSAGRGPLEDENAGTRAELDLSNYNYYWNASEQVKLTVTNQGTTTTLPDLRNVTLSKTSTDNKVAHANFKGDMTLTQFDALSSASKFDYYSYYANGITVNDNDFPNNITFELGQTNYSIAPNTFEAAKTPMVGIVKDREPNISFLQNHTVTHTDNPIHFDYDHTTSYAAIEFDVRLLPGVKVTSLTMTVGSGLTDATRISGTYTYNVASKTGTLSGSGGSNSVTISIPGGMNIGNGEKLYIPMPVKEFRNQMFTFDYITSGGTSGNSYGTKTVSGVKTINFERGKIHLIRVAPPVAKYAANETINITQDGYYYIEAWGGDGGKGRGGREGGVSQKISGLYYLTKGSTLYLYIGSAGASTDGTGGGTAPAGGTNGSSYGNGGNGGNGGTGGRAPGGKGGAGGAGTFVFKDGTNLSNNLLLVSGGAGGGGGSASALFGSYTPGIGGNSGAANAPGGNGGDGGGNQGGNGGGHYNNNTNDSSVGGEGGSYGGPGSNADINGNGGAGANGEGGTGSYSSGAGAGGGGGGYTKGGGGGESGGRSGHGIFGTDVAGGGGGGAGGASFLTATRSNPGYTLPTSNTRPSVNGYIYITFYRE